MHLVRVSGPSVPRSIVLCLRRWRNSSIEFWPLCCAYWLHHPGWYNCTPATQMMAPTSARTANRPLRFHARVMSSTRRPPGASSRAPHQDSAIPQRMRGTGAPQVTLLAPDSSCSALTTTRGHTKAGHWTLFHLSTQQSGDARTSRTRLMPS